MCIDLQSVRDLDCTLGALSLRMLQASRSMDKNDFDGDAVLQRIHVISEALGGDLLESAEANNGQYTLIMDKENAAFVVNMLSDFLELVRSKANTLAAQISNNETAHEIVNKVIDNQLDDVIDNPCELISDERKEELKEILLDRVADMDRAEFFEFADASLDLSISRLEESRSIMRSASRLKDIVFSGLAQRLKQAMQRDQKRREQAIQEMQETVKTSVSINGQTQIWENHSHESTMAPVATKNIAATAPAGAGKVISFRRS